jgi:2-polyprenyl-3-methyl-5-hydroxy-6-metoxy-1,4-benzoquinol methylase
MTDLALIEGAWDQAARENATFNILTDPNYKDDGWPVEEFFAHGRAEIDAAMMRLDTHSPNVGVGAKSALDFGCGVGRTTQALANYFMRVVGVDISEEMIRLARGYDPIDSFGRCSFLHNTRPNLKLFKARTFDLVYSMIVLQHMPQEMQHGYISEFFRVLKPGGMAMFHTPEGPDSGHPGWHLSMFGVPRETVEEWIAGSGGTLIDVEDLGMDSGWRNLRYTAVRA